MLPGIAATPDTAPRRFIRLGASCLPAFVLIVNSAGAVSQETAAARLSEQGARAVESGVVALGTRTRAGVDEALGHFARAGQLYRAALDSTGEARALVRYAGASLETGRSDSALVALHRALALTDARANPDLFAIAVTHLAEVHRRAWYLGGMMVDSALALLRESLRKAEPSDTIFRAGIHRRIGSTLLLRDADSGRVYLEKSVQLAWQSGSDLELGTSLLNLGVAHALTGDDELALVRYRQALSRLARSGDRSREAMTLSGIAQVYERRRDLDSAQVYFHRATVAASQGPSRRAQATIDYNLASFYRTQSRWQPAIKSFRASVEGSISIGDRKHAGDGLFEIGEIYLLIGRLDLASAHFAEAHRLYDSAGYAAGLDLTEAKLRITSYATISDLIERGERDSVLAIADTWMGALEQQIRELNEADDPLLRGLRRSTSTLTPAQRDLTAEEIAYVSADSIRLARDSAFQSLEPGRREAILTELLYLRTMLLLARRTANRETEAQLLFGIGERYSDNGLGFPELATAHFDTALAIQRELPDMLGAAKTARALGRLHHRRRSRPDLAAAVRFYELAAEFRRATEVHTSDEDRLSLAEQDVMHFGEWALAWLARAPEVGDRSAQIGALGAIERGRAQALLDLMRQPARGPPIGDPPENPERLVDGVLQLGSPILSYYLAADTLLTFVILPAGEIDVLRRPLVDTDDLRGLLRGKPPILTESFFRFAGRDTLAAAVARLRRAMGADSVTAREAPRLPEVCATAPPDPDPNYSHWAAKLADIVLPPPLTSSLADHEELIIIPQASLHLVPFASLPIDTLGTPLAAHFALRYAPSLATLLEVEGRPGMVARGEAGLAFNSALVVGDPQMPTVTTCGGASLQLPQLTGAWEEGLAVAQLLRTDHLSGSIASERRVRRELETAAVVHLATHGYAFTSRRRTRESFVALAPGQRTEPLPLLAEEDGLLTVGEILDDQGIRTAAELVTLSACQTGLGNVNRSEGTVGLQRAFLAKGARSVLVSLWSISDDATRLLMTSFYRHWLTDPDRPSKAKALQRAQNDVRSNRRFEHPFYWAPFQLVGAN